MALVTQHIMNAAKEANANMLYYPQREVMTLH